MRQVAQLVARELDVAIARRQAHGFDELITEWLQQQPFVHHATVR